MKVVEVRELLKQYDQEALIEILVQIYKMIPKSRKEIEVDPLIRDFNKIAEDKKGKRGGTTSAIMDFDALENEITEFIDDAYQQRYFAPNWKIAKAKRPKWRFMVKQYLKQLVPVKTDAPYFERTVKLLLELYKMISYACSFYLFSTDDPFRSIGMAQEEFYYIVAERTFATGYS